MDRIELSEWLKGQARLLGFQLAGICPAVSPRGLTRFSEWLDSGYAGEMSYFTERRGAYAHPRSVLDGVRSILMLGMNYHTVPATRGQPGEGRVSRYAWGAVDYHNMIRQRLAVLREMMRVEVPQAKVRGVVDTAPLFERELAQLAGLGWTGKNTLLLNKQMGSWFFLAALLTDVELEYDEPHESDHCGTCRACLDACPTGAFPQPYVLDASRCISYLTIELKDSMPRHLREVVGDWLFGCDVCQEVCPWNRDAVASGEPGFEPSEGMNPVELAALFDLDDAAFRRRYGKSPLWRPRRRGLLRNAAIVLGNRPSHGALPALVKGLDDYEPLVRAACAWALGRHETPAAQNALQLRQAVETDSEVIEELAMALAAHKAVGNYGEKPSKKLAS